MPFSTLIGQEPAVAALRSALERDAVPQAYLFVGPDGAGKATAALELARALVCKKPVDGDSCGSCVNCKRASDGQHPDIARIAPDGEFTRIWQLWSRPGHPAGALESLNFAPIAGPKRIYILERAETLNEESANSLLKALEEPPGYAHFILCAPAPSAVLPTILSRCQLVRFTAVPLALIADALTQRKGLADDEARLLAGYSEGAPGRALRLADAPELREQREALLDLAARIGRSPGIAAFRLAEELRAAAKPGKAKKGEGDDEEKSTRGEMARAIDVLAAWFGDVLQLAVRGEAAPLLHEDRRVEAIAAAKAYSIEQLRENLQTLFVFRRHMARNANAQLATEVLLLKLTPKKA